MVAGACVWLFVLLLLFVCVSIQHFYFITSRLQLWSILMMMIKVGLIEYEYPLASQWWHSLSVCSVGQVFPRDVDSWPDRMVDRTSPPVVTRTYFGTTTVLMLHVDDDNHHHGWFLALDCCYHNPRWLVCAPRLCTDGSFQFQGCLFQSKVSLPAIELSIARHALLLAGFPVLKNFLPWGPGISGLIDVLGVKTSLDTTLFCFVSLDRNKAGMLLLLLFWWGKLRPWELADGPLRGSPSQSLLMVRRFGVLGHYGVESHITLWVNARWPPLMTSPHWTNSHALQ